MVSASPRQLVVAMAAIAAALGWLQLAPAFGFPVTAPAGMLDRVLGADREAGPAGWVLLVLGEGAFVALYFGVIEPRTRGWVAAIAFAIVAWLFSGTVVMPLIGLLQGAPLPGTAPNDPMRAGFFMLELGYGAAAAALVGWLLLGAVLAAGRVLKVGWRALAFTLAAASLAGAVALVGPTLAERAGTSSVAEGPVAALPAGPVFISVLELPQPAGAVLGPHRHIAGFIVGASGLATTSIAGADVDVGPGDALFTATDLLHAHENRAAGPYAIALALVIFGFTIALLLRRGRGIAAALMTALLVAGTVATVDPLMNHWYFVGVRPAAARGAPMPVPAGHRTYESDNLAGLPSGPYREQLTNRWLSQGESIRLVGPAAIVLLDGTASVVVNGRVIGLSDRSGATIRGGDDASVETTSGSARVLLVQILPGN